jgi:FG-GAP repeat
MRRWVVVACSAWLAACGDNAPSPQSLVIVDPPSPSGGGGTICRAGDADADAPGMQIDLHVATGGFETGDRIRLVLDGAATDREATITEGLAIFASVDIAEGFHTFVVTSESGQIASAPLFLYVDSDPPPLTILSPADRVRFATSDDVDTDSDGLQADVEVDADVEDGQAILVKVTGSGGATEGYSGRVEARRALVRVTLPRGTVRISAETENRCGNGAEAHVDLAVEGPSVAACSLELDPLPADGAVYSIVLDPSPEPGFQTVARVRTELSSTVELELDGELVTTAAALDDGSGNGLVEVPLDLGDGARVLAAVCRDPFGQIDRSGARQLLVDTVAPDCSVLAPSAGVTLVPVPQDGQTRELRVDVRVEGTGDTDGEEVEIQVGGDVGSATVEGEVASRVVTLAAPDDDLAVAVRGRDHAGNECSATLGIAYVTAGCGLEWVAPTALVSADADPTTAGVQTELRVRVDEACHGEVVTLTNCATSGPVTATAVGGEAVFSGVTLCSQATCQTTRQCVASVTREGPLTTTLTHTVGVDTQPPTLIVAPFTPSVACGSSLTPSDDIDGATTGVQIDLLVAGDAVERSVDQTPAGAPIGLTGNLARVTLALGANVFVARGRDAAGLEGTSAPCTVRLGTLGIEIDSPAAGALLGADDGVLSGNELLVQVCGDVGEAPSASVVVRVDGVATSDVPATVNPASGRWCAADVPLDEGPHTLTAIATSTSGNGGDAAITITVELTPPETPAGLSITALDRRSVALGFVEPAGATSCAIKQSHAAIPDDAAWDAIPGEGIAAGGGAPGETTTRVVPTKPGRPWFFAVRCRDTAGNRSPLLASASPTVVDFVSGLELGPTPIAGYDISDSLFGEAIVGADLDDDGRNDLVVSAPGVIAPGGAFADGAVYVFLAREGGITGAQPDYVLVGAPDSFFGQSLARVDWNHDGIDDLAVGAPLDRGFQGEVAVFYGGSAFGPTATTVVRSEAAADVELFADPGDPRFVFALFGWGLDRVDFDGDGRDDLTVGMPGASDFGGAAVVLFAPVSGPPPSSAAIPSDLGSSTGMAAFGFSFPAYPDPSARQYGTDVVGLGAPGDGAAEALLISPSIGKGTFQTSAGVIASKSHFVYAGRPRPLLVAPFQVLAETAASDELVMPVEPENAGFGFQATSLRDVDGDGHREIVLGYPTDAIRTGTVLIFRGGTSTGGKVVHTEATALARIDGRAINTFLGNAVGGGGDVDGDLREDLLFCSARDGDRPHLYAWYGGEGTAHTDLQANPPFHYERASPLGWDHCSNALWVGDLNGDGLSDVVWGDKNGERRPDPPLPPRPQRIQVLY